MKLKLPKSNVGVKFPRISIIAMKEFDIDLFLPSLFFTILAQGRGKARRANDPKAITQFIDTMAQHSALEGVQEAEGRRVLERFVRTALITTGSVGRSHVGEQITSITPYTLLAHKPGFPVGRHQGGVDTFIYQILRECIGAEDALRSFVKNVFGSGVIIGSISELGGEYDGETELDTLTRISIAFLDGFENTRPGIFFSRSLPGLVFSNPSRKAMEMRVSVSSPVSQSYSPPSSKILPIIIPLPKTFFTKLLNASSAPIHSGSIW